MNNSTFEQTSEMGERRDFYITVIVINALSGVSVATVLNLLIIVTFVKTPSLRTPSNILILSLAITDFGVGALVQPLYSKVIFANVISKDTSVSLPFVLSVVGNVLFSASLLTVTAITVDRFLALYLSLRYQEIVTKRRTSIAVIMIWTFSVSLTCLPLIISDNAEGISQINTFFFLSLLFINIALMLKISCIINRHAAQIRLQQQAMNAQPGEARNIKRSVNMMYYILGAFFLCYFPCIFFNIIVEYYSLPEVDFVWIVVWDMAYAILFMNSSINPIIYFWRIQDMRNAALQLLPYVRRNNNNENAENDIYELQWKNQY